MESDQDLFAAAGGNVYYGLFSLHSQFTMCETSQVTSQPEWWEVSKRHRPQKCASFPCDHEDTWFNVLGDCDPKHYLEIFWMQCCSCVCLYKAAGSLLVITEVQLAFFWVWINHQGSELSDGENQQSSNPYICSLFSARVRPLDVHMIPVQSWWPNATQAKDQRQKNQLCLKREGRAWKIPLIIANCSQNHLKAEQFILVRQTS